MVQATRAHPWAVSHWSRVLSKKSCRSRSWAASYSDACKIISSLSKSLHSRASCDVPVSYSHLQCSLSLL